MKFIVCRTSGDWLGREQPCPEAKQETELRTTDGYRCMPWIIEIEGLEALLDFAKKYDEIIVKQWHLNHEYMEIEIYDDYR